jgi:hypothetical protein
MRMLAAILLLCAAAAAQTAKPPVGTEANAAATSATFTDAVANDLLDQLARGMEGRNARQALAAFDAAKLPGYGRFSGQLNAWFRDHASFKVYYRLRQVAVEDGRGVALVDFDYEATPATEGGAPVRRHAQLRLTCERGAKGWKITEFSPRDLFS